MVIAELSLPVGNREVSTIIVSGWISEFGTVSLSGGGIGAAETPREKRSCILHVSAEYGQYAWCALCLGDCRECLARDHAQASDSN